MSGGSTPSVRMIQATGPEGLSMELTEKRRTTIDTQKGTSTSKSKRLPVERGRRERKYAVGKASKTVIAVEANASAIVLPSIPKRKSS